MGRKKTKPIIISALIFYCSFFFGDNFTHAETAGRISPSLSSMMPQAYNTEDSLVLLTGGLRTALMSGDLRKASILADRVEKLIISEPGMDEKATAYPLYLIGFTKSNNGDASESLLYYYKVLSILDKHPADSLAGKVNYNMGVSYNKIGDDIRSEFFFSRSADFVKKGKGEYAPELAMDYLSLSVANINIRNYEESVRYANLGLAIGSAKPDSVSPSTLALLYQTKGTALGRISEYTRAALNLSRALRLYEENSLPADDFYINLVDNLASINFYLGNIDKSIEIYEQGVRTFLNNDDYAVFSLLSNYAGLLGKHNMHRKGEEVLADAIVRLQGRYSSDSPEYVNALAAYAGYIREYSIDPARSQGIYLKCFEYTNKNPWDLNTRTTISLGYALSLLSVNKPETALDSINSILFRDAGIKKPVDMFENPDASQLNRDSRTLDILQAKHSVLKRLSAGSNDMRILKCEANTAELVITVIENIRLNLGEEQSRLLLGDRYRNAYLNAIRSFICCYKESGSKEYLEKAFEFSERSKAASLLASIREMKAMKFFIPTQLVAAERKAFEEISYYTAKLEEEKNRKLQDDKKLYLWETNLLAAVAKRDSLKMIFEKNYRDYYDLKYNTSVIRTSDIQKLIGRNRNYISYVVSDTVLYILVLNRKQMHVESVVIDTALKNLIVNYRKLLSEPDKNSNARKEYELYQKYGYSLYSRLFKPVEGFLVSDNLIISPDNLLAFFPFETLITSEELRKDLYYSRLPYLMNDFLISYTYSATLLSESEPAKPSLRNNVAAFAPSYENQIYVDSISVNRQLMGGTLPTLRYAREEAVFVSEFTSGVSYLDSRATKNTYLGVARNFDVIHLAMHTVLNSRDQLNSGMIFAGSAEADRYLRPFEIYTVPLNAKMVVLSSCYTGTGTLYAGEGVLSIARGFIFSGSRSVVMSLWEVDDRAGTDIVKEFYRQLRKGKEKSDALRRARLDYLAKADMLRAHPYFWSTMVVYGDNSPLYISLLTKSLLLLIFFLLGILGYSYLRKR